MEKKAQREAQVYLELKDQKGEYVFGVAYIDAFLIDTSLVHGFMTVTDVSGRETISRVNLQINTKVNCGVANSLGTMKVASSVANRCQSVGITALNVKMTGTAGDQARPGALALLSALKLKNMKVGRIQSVPPIPSNSTRRIKVACVIR